MRGFIVFSIVLLVSLGIWLSQAGAYELQITPSGTVDVTGQSIVYFDLVFDPQGESINFGTYTFNVLYDASELAWNSNSSSTYAPSPLIPQLLGGLEEPTPGEIWNFNAGSFTGYATLDTPFTLAHLAFDVVNPVWDGTADVEFDTRVDNRFGFTINNSNIIMADMPVSTNTPDVGTSTVPPVVPEPVSSVLFIVGGSTLGLWRYRRRNR